MTEQRLQVLEREFGYARQKLMNTDEAERIRYENNPWYGRPRQAHKAMNDAYLEVIEHFKALVQ